MISSFIFPLTVMMHFETAPKERLCEALRDSGIEVLLAHNIILDL